MAMNNCASCGQLILFGGVTVENFRFCNETCRQNAQQLIAQQYYGQQIPQTVLAREIAAAHQSNCPLCGGPGPIDIHTGYQVWSMLVLTQHRDVPKVCCQSCGSKHRWHCLGLSAVAGWWGFPWGLIFTPMQIIKNIGAICKPPDPQFPSPEFQELVRNNIALHQMHYEAQQPPPAPG